MGRWAGLASAEEAGNTTTACETRQRGRAARRKRAGERVHETRWGGQGEGSLGAANTSVSARPGVSDLCTPGRSKYREMELDLT